MKLLYLYLLVMFFITLFFFVVFGVSPVEATNYVREGVLVDPSSSYATCGDSNICGNLTECWNSESPGVTDCVSACRIDGEPFGSAWTKYRYSYCAETRYNPETDEATCAPVYNEASAVYSTADKCSDGSNNPPFEQYLRSGQCDGNIGGIYKTCCSNDGGISSDSCVPITPFSGAPTPPMDGVCPGGSYEFMCGVSSCAGITIPCTTDACGPAVCGSIAPPPEPVPTSEPPPPTPTPLCVPNSWDSTSCTRCKADGSGWNANCTDFGPNPPPGNDWCSCESGFWVDQNIS